MLSILKQCCVVTQEGSEGRHMTHSSLLAQCILSAFALNEEHVQLKQTTNENQRLDQSLLLIIPALQKDGSCNILHSHINHFMVL